ncbi:MAG: NADH-quinone oxidoreductase subunit A [Anaerolineae bacterium]
MRRFFSIGGKQVAEFGSVLIYFALVAGFAGGAVLFSTLLGPRREAAQKRIPYESGILPVGPARRRFSVKFYLVAVLFILFDIEVVFMYPWAVSFRELGVPGLIEMGLFVGVLLLGLFYLWRRGALEWQ